MTDESSLPNEGDILHAVSGELVRHTRVAVVEPAHRL